MTETKQTDVASPPFCRLNPDTGSMMFLLGAGFSRGQHRADLLNPTDDTLPRWFESEAEARANTKLTNGATLWAMIRRQVRGDDVFPVDFSNLKNMNVGQTKAETDPDVLKKRRTRHQTEFDALTKDYRPGWRMQFVNLKAADYNLKVWNYTRRKVNLYFGVTGNVAKLLQQGEFTSINGWYYTEKQLDTVIEELNGWLAEVHHD